MKKFVLPLIFVLLTVTVACKNTDDKLYSDLDMLNAKIYDKTDSCALIAFAGLKDIIFKIESGNLKVDNEMYTYIERLYSEEELMYITLTGARNTLSERLKIMKDKIENLPNSKIYSEYEAKFIEINALLNVCNVEQAAKYVNNVEKLLNNN